MIALAAALGALVFAGSAAGAGSTLTLTPDETRVIRGGAISLTASASATGIAGASGRVTLQRAAGRGWVRAGACALTRDGSCVIRWRAGATLGAASLRAAWRPAPGRLALSRPVRLSVVARAYSLSARAASGKRLLAGDIALLRGSVSPASRLLVERSVAGGRWTVVRRLGRTGGAFRVQVPTGAGADPVYRLRAPGSGSVAGAVSRPIRLRVSASGARIVARKTTVIAAAAQVLAVSGDPAGEQRTTLASGARVPGAGGFLVVGAIPLAPAGVLGQVRRIEPGPGGSTIVVTAPASIGQAYSTFQIAAGRSFGGAGPSGAGVSEFGRKRSFATSTADTVCDKPGLLPPKISYDGDLVRTNISFVALRPSLSMSFSGNPKLTLDAKLGAGVRCSLRKGPYIWQVWDTPSIVATVTPVLEAYAGADGGWKITWQANYYAGIDVDPWIGQTATGFSSTVTPGPLTLRAGAKLTSSVTAALSVAGRQAASGGFDSNLEAQWLGISGDSSCLKLADTFNVSLGVDATVLGKRLNRRLDWRFGKDPLWQACPFQYDPVISGSLTAGEVGMPYDVTLREAAGHPGVFRLAGGALPPGLSLSPGGRVTGTPTQPGSFQAQISLTFSNGRTTTDPFPINIRPPAADPNVLRVAVGLGSQSVSLRGVPLTGVNGIARFGSVVDLVANLGPWSSCSTLGKGGQMDPVATWPGGLQVGFGDLSISASCSAAGKAVTFVHVTAPGWLVETELGSFRVGGALPAALAATGKRSPYSFKGGPVSGEAFSWPLQDPCSPSQPTIENRLTAVVGLDGRVTLAFVSTGTREAECP